MSNKILIVKKNNNTSGVDIETVRKIVLEEVLHLTLNGVEGPTGATGPSGLARRYERFRRC